MIGVRPFSVERMRRANYSRAYASWPVRYVLGMSPDSSADPVEWARLMGVRVWTIDATRPNA